jgi:hypothetical protein
MGVESTSSHENELIPITVLSMPAAFNMRIQHFPVTSVFIVNRQVCPSARFLDLGSQILCPSHTVFCLKSNTIASRELYVWNFTTCNENSSHIVQGTDISFSSIGANGHLLRAVKDVAGPLRISGHKVTKNHQWRVQDNRLFNVATNNELNLLPQLLNIVSLDEVRGLERHALRSERELQAKVRSSYMICACMSYRTPVPPSSSHLPKVLVTSNRIRQHLLFDSQTQNADFLRIQYTGDTVYKLVQHYLFSVRRFERCKRIYERRNRIHVIGPF